MLSPRRIRIRHTDGRSPPWESSSIQLPRTRARFMKTTPCTTTITGSSTTWTKASVWPRHSDRTRPPFCRTTAFSPSARPLPKPCGGSSRWNAHVRYSWSPWRRERRNSYLTTSPCRLASSSGLRRPDGFRPNRCSIRSSVATQTSSSNRELGSAREYDTGFLDFGWRPTHHQRLVARAVCAPGWPHRRQAGNPAPRLSRVVVRLGRRHAAPDEPGLSRDAPGFSGLRQQRQTLSVSLLAHRAGQSRAGLVARPGYRPHGPGRP